MIDQIDYDSLISALMLGQDGAAPPAPAEGIIPLEGTDPAGTGTGPGRSKSPFGGQFMVIMLVVLGGFILFSVMGQRRDRKKREQMIKAVKKHDRVQTIGGVIGSIIEIKPDTVVLKVDESSNIRITFARSAIQQVLTVAPDAEAPPGDSA